MDDTNQNPTQNTLIDTQSNSDSATSSDLDEPIQPTGDVKTPSVESNTAASFKFVDTSSVTKWDQTQDFIKSIEKKIGTRLLVIYIGLRSSLSPSDIEYIFNHVEAIGETDKITVLLFGPGGSGIAATRIVYMLRKYCKNLEFIIPSEAASACTMLALGGDKIWMGPLSSLSPIDSSIANHQLAPKGHDGYPVSIEVTQIQKFIELCNSGMSTDKVDEVNKSPYALLSQHLHPIVIGSIQRILSLSKLLTTDILKTHMNDEEKVRNIVDKLNDTFPTHSYPITYEKALELGINVSLMPSDLNTMCLKYIKVMNALAKGGSNENQGVQISYTRDVIFETVDMRTTYYNERKYVLDKGKWVYSTSNAMYKVYAPREDEKGVTRVKLLDMYEL